MHRYSTRAGQWLLVLAAGCGGGADSRAQKLADYYAPGVKLSAPLLPAAKAHFRLEPLPIPGFADTSYVGPDGVHVLGIMLEAPANSKAFDNAPVGSVTLGLPTRGAFLRVLARANRELGKPTHDLCFGNDASSARRMLIWQTSRGKGVSVSGTPAAWSTAADAELDSLSTSAHALGLNTTVDVGPITHQACPTG